jgi:hypothetical protein
MDTQETAASLWTAYRDETVVRRAEHYSKFTIPSLMVDPLLGAHNEDIRHDFQSAGAMLLNNLAAKLTSLLFPSNQPFFKNVVNDELRAQAKAAGVGEDTINAQLSVLEQEATKNLFINASFAKLTRTIKLLIATGQALVYRDPDTQKFRVWSLQSFSVKRDAAGDWSCIVLKQRMLFSELPPEVQNDAQAKKPGRYDNKQKLDVFTKIQREPGTLNPKVVVTNELDGTRVGPVAQYPVHLCPWIVPVWNLADGEDYARGMVEEYAGDFAKLSILSENLGLYELGSLEWLNLVNEAGGSTVDDLEKTQPGDYVPGGATAVTSYERGDYQKMNAITASISGVIQRLSAAFMYTGNARDAERVTAAEIRQQASEAENTLGGVYSILAESLQAPLAYLMMKEVSEEIVPGLITKAFYPQIITGIPALNRNIEVQNLLTAVQEGAAIIQIVTQMDQRLDPNKVLDLIYRSHAVDVTLLSKSPAVLKQEADQRLQAANAQQQVLDPALQPNPEVLA